MPGRDRVNTLVPPDGTDADIRELRLRSNEHERRLAVVETERKNLGDLQAKHEEEDRVHHTEQLNAWKEVKGELAEVKVVLAEVQSTLKEIRKGTPAGGGKGNDGKGLHLTIDATDAKTIVGIILAIIGALGGGVLGGRYLPAADVATTPPAIEAKAKDDTAKPTGSGSAGTGAAIAVED